ncbi:MAG: dTMP kinase [Pyrinomonadaceae bacterium]
MKEMKFYGTALPQVEIEPYSGKLIVVEGTDGVGRSTHIALLRTWLESRGHAVLDTGMTRSILAGRGIKEAKQGHTLGRLTMQLFYATDFADRLQNEMLPALRAGFIVLTDRYIYSAIARGVMRGADPAWMRSIYGIALVPDAVFYLRVASAEELVPRVLAFGRGFDYWESGMDLHPDKDFYDSFIKYQNLLLKEFDRMTGEYGFRVIDATRSIRRVAADLRRVVANVIDEEQTDGVTAAAAVIAPAPVRPARAGVKAAAVHGAERAEGAGQR